MNIVLSTLKNSVLNFTGTKKQYKSQYKMPQTPKGSLEHDAFIKSKVKEAKTTNPEAYKNLANIADKIPKNELGTEALNNYLNGQDDFNKFLKQCSIIHELYLLNGSRSYDVDAIGNVSLLEQEFERGGVNASNYELAAHLVEDNELHPNVLTFNKVKGNFTPQFVEDLDKIYEAKINNQSLQSVFVPEFKNKKEAQMALNAGEVCHIEGEKNISIKLKDEPILNKDGIKRTKDGEIKELFITPETYMELFPPAQRFALSQGGTGDCFLISAFNSAYLNPASRHLILEMFKENPDGTLDTSIEGFKKQNGKVVLKNPKAFELKDVQNNAFDKEDIEDNFSRFVSQFEAFRILETTTRKGSENSAYEKIKKHHDFCTKGVEKLQNDDDFITYRGQNYTKKEMQAFLDLVEDIDNKELTLQTMVSLKDIFIDFDLGLKETKALINILEKNEQQVEEEEDRAYIDYFKCSLKRGLEYAKKYNKDAVRLDFMTYNFYNELTGEDIDSEIDYINGGTSAAVFRKMGLKTKKINTTTARRQEQYKLNNFFADKDFNSKYLAGVSSFGNDRSKIIQAHAYSMNQIKQVKKDGKLMYAFINPHNGAKETPLTAHQLKKAFTEFEFALIE